MKKISLLNDDNLGFIILCPDYNRGGLKYTSTSISCEFPKAPFITMVSQDAPKNEVIELTKHSRVLYAGKTITSLINSGMNELKTEWCMVVMSGCMIRNNVIKKYKYFLKSEKDILFSVIDRKYLFDEASINGILINREGYREIGELDTEESDIGIAKLIWANKAIDKGYCFKALVGARL